MAEIKDGFRRRYLEEREARKDLERDVRRVKKECKAKIDVLQTTASTLKGGRQEDNDRDDENQDLGRYSPNQHSTYRNSERIPDSAQSKNSAYVDNNDFYQNQNSQHTIQPFYIDQKHSLNEPSEQEDSQTRNKPEDNAQASRHKYYTHTDQNNQTFQSGETESAG